jgi:hypothetical protein
VATARLTEPAREDDDANREDADVDRERHLARPCTFSS